MRGEIVALVFMDYAGKYTTRAGRQAAAYEFWSTPISDFTATEVLFGLGGAKPGDDDLARRMEARPCGC